MINGPYKFATIAITLLKYNYVATTQTMMC